MSDPSLWYLLHTGERDAAENMAVRHATPYGEQSPRESFVRTLLGDHISFPARRPTTEECQEKYSSLKEYFYLFEWAHPL